MSKIAMPEESSDSMAMAHHTTADTMVDILSGPNRLLMLALNFLPLAHLTAAVLTGAMLRGDIFVGLSAGLAVLYVVPPCLARILLAVVPMKEGSLAIGSRYFFVWWTLLNLQMVFCRLPFLEELMRLVPGLYSMWLRLWGSRIGRLTYWSSGTMILDRPFLEIGDDVVFGAGVRLNPHVIAHDEEGRARLLLARVRIGDRVTVGGYSLLTAGTIVEADEVVRACLWSPPFSHWSGGRRIKAEKPAPA